MICGLSHITFIVRNLDRTEKIFTDVLNARKIYNSGEITHSLSKERYFQIGELWIAIMEGDPLSEKTYNHVAFKIEEADFDRYLKAINALGLQIRKGRARIEAEGRSIYFYDYDNHLFELHTGTLSDRLQCYEGDQIPSNNSVER